MLVPFFLPRSLNNLKSRFAENSTGKDPGGGVLPQKSKHEEERGKRRGRASSGHLPNSFSNLENPSLPALSQEHCNPHVSIFWVQLLNLHLINTQTHSVLEGEVRWFSPERCAGDCRELGHQREWRARSCPFARHMESWGFRGSRPEPQDSSGPQAQALFPFSRQPLRGWCVHTRLCLLQ